MYNLQSFPAYAHAARIVLPILTGTQVSHAQFITQPSASSGYAHVPISLDKDLTCLFSWLVRPSTMQLHVASSKICISGHLRDLSLHASDL